MRSADLRRLRQRIRIAQIAIGLGFLVLGLRATHLSLWDPRGAERGQRQLLTAVSLTPDRGRLLDRRGDELALTVSAPSVYAVPATLDDLDATATALARALDRDTGAVRQRLAGARGFVFVARWIDAARAERVRALELPGVGVLNEPRRAYPHGSLAAGVLGFANIDGVGVRGLEQQEDAWLAGRPRRVAVERDARGHLLVGPGLDPRASAGGDVLTTLDATLQAEAETALAQAVARSRARGGFAICVDPPTGEILALAELPSFDLNDFRRTPYSETRLRAALDLTEPGSTFKAFLAAAALEDGAVSPAEIFALADGVRVPGKWIRDQHPEPALDLPGILRVSSNAGAVLVAQRLGPERHYDLLRRFGFGEPTGSGFPEEAAGMLRGWRRWKPLDHATIAFGQGVSVTGLQMAAATAALGNGGVWRAPQLVKARRRAGGPWEPADVGASRPVVSRASADAVVAMLEGVVEGGTGRRAGLADVRVAGKTGTAQKLDVEAQRYSDDRYRSWFVGLAPAEAPRLAMVVAIDEPQGLARGGGDVAAPVFAQVAAAHLTRLGIPTTPRVKPPAPADPPPGPEVRIAEGPAPVAAPAPTEPAPAAPLPAGPAPAPVAAPRPASEPVVRAGRTDLPAPRAQAQVLREGDRIFLPDLQGMTPAEVERALAEAPVVVEILGRGRAVAQEPAPGTILAAGQWRVRVRFEPEGEG